MLRNKKNAVLTSFTAQQCILITTSFLFHIMGIKDSPKGISDNPPKSRVLKGISNADCTD